MTARKVMLRRLMAAWWVLVWMSGPVAGSSAALLSATNASAIVINDSFDPPTKAAPYPSMINVALPPGPLVTKVTVTIRGLSHNYPSDIDILLVGPHGQSALLMSEVGGSQPLPVFDLTLTFDDDATNALSVDDWLLSGTFKPTARHADLGFDFPFPAPAADGRYDSVLSVFKGSDPSGAWNLFVVDDSSSDAGNIAAGWSIDIAYAVPLAASVSQGNMIISWPVTPQPCQLQFSSNPALNSAWANVGKTPAMISGHYIVTNPIAGDSGYFRLIQ